MDMRIVFEEDVALAVLNVEASYIDCSLERELPNPTGNGASSGVKSDQNSPMKAATSSSAALSPPNPTPAIVNAKIVPSTLEEEVSFKAPSASTRKNASVAKEEPSQSDSLVAVCVSCRVHALSPILMIAIPFNLASSS